MVVTQRSRSYLSFEHHSKQEFQSDFENFNQLYESTECNYDRLWKYRDQFIELLNKYHYLGAQDWSGSYNGVASQTAKISDSCISDIMRYIREYFYFEDLLESIKALTSNKFEYSMTKLGMGDVRISTNCPELNEQIPKDSALNRTCTTYKALKAFESACKFLQ